MRVDAPMDLPPLTLPTVLFPTLRVDVPAISMDERDPLTLRPRAREAFDSAWHGPYVIHHV
jgi:hypothetical protein